MSGVGGLQLGLFSPRWENVASSTRPKDKERAAWTNPFLTAHTETLRTAGGERLSFDEKLWNHGSTAAVGVDVEVFRNFFVVCFQRYEDGKRLAFEMSERTPLNKKAVLYVLRKNLIISFNGISYDFAMIALALSGADCQRIKEASDQIIRSEIRSWEIERNFTAQYGKINHIDLIEPNPAVRQGLKVLHGRLHGRYMVDLPYDPDAWLTHEKMNVVTLYCFNDLEATGALYAALEEPLALRVALGNEYGLDLRSKSDAQVGEAIVKREVERATGRRLERAQAASPSFGYTVPSFLKFNDWRLNALLRELGSTEFRLNIAGKIETPAVLDNLTVSVGAARYTMGIGGLHSVEAHRALHSDEKRSLIDVDVASQYPNIIMKLGLYPRALGPAFLDIYGKLIKERLAAKDAGDKVKADGGRVAVNGIYGKLGSPYSVLSAPHLLIATTLTGQLSILMLIERAELSGIPVVSANTDGVVFYCPCDKEPDLEMLLRVWENDTGFSVDKTRYAAIFNSSVNTYIAIKEDGKVKRKGVIANPWADGDLRGQMMKNPQMTICSEAILRYITENASIENTIINCKDPRAFVTVNKVTGGATWRGHELGRAIRYYWSTDGDPIMAAGGSRKVAKTEGSKPLLEMTEVMPNDIDYLRYCEEAVRLAVDLGIAL